MAWIICLYFARELMFNEMQFSYSSHTPRVLHSWNCCMQSNRSFTIFQLKYSSRKSGYFMERIGYYTWNGASRLDWSINDKSHQALWVKIVEHQALPEKFGICYIENHSWLPAAVAPYNQQENQIRFQEKSFLSSLILMGVKLWISACRKMVNFRKNAMKIECLFVTSQFLSWLKGKILLYRIK